MKVKTTVVCGIFAAITCILAPLSFPIPGSPVPFSMAFFAVFLCGALLPPKPSALAQIIYLILGCVGLPVFAKYNSGLGTLFGPTGGYLISYPIMAYIISSVHSYLDKLVFNKPNFNTLALFLSIILSIIFCYSLGTIWLMYYLGISFNKALLMGVIPFIPFDIIKSISCCLLVSAVRTRRAIPNLSSQEFDNLCNEQGGFVAKKTYY